MPCPRTEFGISPAASRRGGPPEERNEMQVELVWKPQTPGRGIPCPVEGKISGPFDRIVASFLQEHLISEGGGDSGASADLIDANAVPASDEGEAAEESPNAS